MFGKEVGLSSNLVDNSIIILTGLAQRWIEAVDNRAKQYQIGFQLLVSAGFRF